MTQEFKPGMELVPPPAKKACIHSTFVDGQRYRCTDAALDYKLYCALHLKARNDEKEARRKAQRKAMRWWPF